MIPAIRLSAAARRDIASILRWSAAEFGVDARDRYATLIATAMFDAATNPSGAGRQMRRVLGDRVFTWHLMQSRTNAGGPPVRRPRHFLVCRDDGDVLIVGRVLHDSMDAQQQLGSYDWA